MVNIYASYWIGWERVHLKYSGRNWSLSLRLSLIERSTLISRSRGLGAGNEPVRRLDDPGHRGWL